MSVRVGHIIEGKERWGLRHDRPKGGTIGDCLSYGFPAKVQGPRNNLAVYDVLAVSLTWLGVNAEWVDPLLDALKPELRAQGMKIRDRIYHMDGHYTEIWFAPAHSRRDNVRRFRRACKRLGWQEVITGYWPDKDVPAYIKAMEANK